MRSCPFNNCNNRVAGANFCCTRHWHTLAREFRDRAFEVYRDFANGKISVERLIEEQFRIADESEFESTSESREDLYVSCPGCGQTCFSAKYQGTMLLLDPTHYGVSGDFVVVGGVAYGGSDARAKVVIAPGLAKLRVHICSSVGNGCQKGVAYGRVNEGSERRVG